ncbi:glycosyltransferase family 4 protein [Bosea sp. MMO-172]|uniref:glycosyltransferase family 4 protein n=1 Tax=Bosea sp. MMO-172 TaxID=3127885 RepID=UPI0030176E1D
MRLLFCCEFYHPSVGGVQEVMRQVAERLIKRGHEVTVATTGLPNRTALVHNGVRIEEFAVAGNLVSGLEGEVERYQRFVANFGADAVLVKAAQQWTFDALWPTLPTLTSRKVFIPCGFSGLYDQNFAAYYEQMRDLLPLLDHFIFYSEDYRDIAFVRQAGMRNLSLVPNGACEQEFMNQEPRSDLRERLGIDANAFVFLSVGSLTSIKGHTETAEAFARMDTGGAASTLILNANRPRSPAAQPPGRRQLAGQLGRHLVRTLRDEGLWATVQRVRAKLEGRGASDVEGQIRHWTQVAASQPGKQILLTDLPRDELVDAYKTADLFVFASNIEYSPLVLYEAAAAGTPFLSVPVGNAEEIARRTGAGLICPAPVDARGFTRVVPADLAEAMRRAMEDRERLREMGRRGREAWRTHFTWQRISEQYEEILCGPVAAQNT